MSAAKRARSTLPPLMMTPTRLPCELGLHPSRARRSRGSRSARRSSSCARRRSASPRPAAASLAVSTSASVAADDREGELAELTGSGRRRRSSAASSMRRCARRRGTTAGRRCRPRARRRRPCSAAPGRAPASAEPVSRPPPPRQTNRASSGAGLLDQLLGRGALAGDDVGMVERRDQRQAALRRRGAGRSPRGPRVKRS